MPNSPDNTDADAAVAAAATTAAAFRTAYIELIGNKPPDAELRVAERMLTVATPAQVREYVAQLPEFYQKHAETIAKVHLINYGTEPDQEMVQRFIPRFKRPDYSPADLAREMMCGIPEGEGEGEEEEGGGRGRGRGAEEDGVRGGGGGAAARDTEAMLRFARAWATATGRQMNVYEFIRYSSQSLDRGAMKAVADKQEDAMLFVTKIHRDFIGKGITRDDFFDRYIFSYDQPDFHAEVVASVMDSDDYRDEMCRHLASLYVRLFGADMHADDLMYTFHAIRAKRMPLHSEEIVGELMFLNEQLMAIEADTNAVYEEVLRRPADPDEIRDRVNAHRAFGADEGRARLRRDLYNSLEYHDVLKEVIAEWFRATDRHPRPKLVYDKLSELLRRYADRMEDAAAELATDG